MVVVSKNKRFTKGGKKGAKKKVADPFSKKDWYDVKAPAMFSIGNIGKTCHENSGTKIASDDIKGHVFEVNQGDLENDEVAFRKLKLITGGVQNKNCLNFHGMDPSCDRMSSVVKNWQTMVEARVDVKTTNAY